MKTSTVYDCTTVELGAINSDRGSLTVVENDRSIPFSVKRIYYLYDIPTGSSRGGHAHKELHQLILAASGSFDLLIDDGQIKRTISLNRPHRGVLLVPGIWRELENFSAGAVCLVLASDPYTEDDYIRNYDEFVEAKRKQ